MQCSASWGLSSCTVWLRINVEWNVVVGATGFLPLISITSFLWFQLCSSFCLQIHVQLGIAQLLTWSCSKVEGKQREKERRFVDICFVVVLAGFGVVFFFFPRYFCWEKGGKFPGFQLHVADFPVSLYSKRNVKQLQKNSAAEMGTE